MKEQWGIQHVLTVTVTLTAKTKWRKEDYSLGLSWEGHSWWPLDRGLHVALEEVEDRVSL